MLDFLDVTWVNLSFFTQSRDLSSWLYLQRPVAKVENNGFGGSEPLLQVNISIPRIVGVFGKFHMASLENERNKIKIKKEYYGYMVTEVTMNIQKHGQLIR